MGKQCESYSTPAQNENDEQDLTHALQTEWLLCERECRSEQKRCTRSLTRTGEVMWRDRVHFSLSSPRPGVPARDRRPPKANTAVGIAEQRADVSQCRRPRARTSNGRDHAQEVPAGSKMVRHRAQPEVLARLCQQRCRVPYARDRSVHALTGGRHIGLRNKKAH